MKQCKCCGYKTGNTAVYCPSCGATVFSGYNEGDSTYSDALKKEIHLNQQINYYGTNSGSAADNIQASDRMGVKQAKPRKQNVFLGILGAIIGFIITIFIWILLDKMGIYMYIQGIFMIFIPCGLYELFAGKPKLVATVLICSIALIFLYYLEKGTNILNLQEQYESYYGEEVDFKEASDLYEYHLKNQKDYKREIIFKYGINYVGSVLGVYAYIVNTVKKEGKKEKWDSYHQ